MPKSNTSRPPRESAKPLKPYPEFPLFAHATKRWAKKIRGKLHYFGRWDDPQGSLERFNREWPFLSQGRTPPAVDTGDGCTIRVLCNGFLNSKRHKLESGELSERSFRDYFQTCEGVVEYLGKDRRVDDLRPDDFEGYRSKLAARFGVVTLRNEINRVRVVFKYAHDQRLIDKPVSYGQSFDRPSAKALRKSRNTAGKRTFEPAELKLLLSALDGEKVTLGRIDDETGKPKEVTRPADPTLKAMLLLGVNCGFGNTDCASLPLSAVDLDAGWIDFPRPKTEINRRVPLWPETVKALRTAIAARPAPKDKADAGLCFLTQHGRPWVRLQEHREKAGHITSIDAISQRFATLMDSIDLNGHRNFYSLRHTFETIGGESRDQVATNAIMGHVDATMAAVYRHGISDDRLQTVVNTVRAWLWPQAKVAVKKPVRR